MVSNESTYDIVLSSQLVTEFNEEKFTYNEEVLSNCINSMILASSDILADIHAYTYHEVTGESGECSPVEDITFESCKESLEDIVLHLFSILNKIKVDAPTYAEIMDIRNSIPMTARADRALSVISLLQSITDLSTCIWKDLDSGNSNLMQVALKKGGGVDEELSDIEDEILSISGAILALVDTICQHVGKSLRDVL